ncbi:hypothetical protein STCU_00519 [Strigomonas culicis]|nr:hypothetical protein STCU_00519 [Strigomonas culicis]|eukprot:EPY36562.1 hypothetical protein STCU_00519 [Strigomonas culicis]
MLETYSAHPLGYERYGGLTCSDAAVGSPTIFYNASSLHSPGIGLYDLYNSIFTTSKGSQDVLLTTVVNVMPKTLQEQDAMDSLYAMMIAIIIMIPFTFIPSTYVSWIVKEKACKARHLQSVSGLYFSLYWLTNFLFDIASYIITMFLVIFVFLIFDRKEYVARNNVGATIILFFLYGLSGVAMAYALSFLFSEHASAQNTVMLANFIAGFLLVLCVAVLSIIDSTKDVGSILRWVFRVIPSYCVGEGISNLAVLRLETALGSTKSAWSMDVTGWPIVYMLIELPFFVFVTIFIDHPGRRQRSQRLFHRPDAPPEVIEDEDEDVVKEREDVLHSEERKSDLVDVKYLRKVYGNGKVAVRNVTFGIRPGEVFGFLGTNGAGKTTTISILCQEFYPTSGYASVCGSDIVNESREALRYIGYCPQFDATLDLLTPEEHLWVYAGIRGVSYAQRRAVVEGLLKMCELTPYRGTLAHRLSGGNRRKLSVAIALIGGPRVVFLDEPSAGMDPVARRGLWNAIETVADNCSVVLTTHHLEEVEAVAHRVAIMVEGTLECIGNKTHLKKKFGTGFEVNLRVSKDTEELRHTVTTFFDERFHGAKLIEYRARRFTFELPGTTKLSHTFKLLQEHHDMLHITDYNVSQTSIEQVFLQISEEAEHRMERELEARIEKKRKACGCFTCCTCCS